MKTKYALGIALELLLIGGATNARADGIDLFTLTDGTNTMTWSLPSSPTPSIVAPTAGFVIDGVTVVENGTTTVTQDLIFYLSSDGGGASNFPEFPVTLFDLFGAQVFMGNSLSSPTFVPGTYTFTDPSDTWVLSDATDLTLDITPSGVPEPSSLLLLGIGFVSLAPVLRKSLRKLA